MTNGGLDRECRRLRDGCASCDTSVLGSFAGELQPRFKADQASILAFLRVLRITNDVPQAAHVRAVDVEEFARPTLLALTLAVEAAADVYDAVLDLVRDAARAAGPERGPWLLSSPGALDSGQLLARDRARRTVTRQQVMRVVRQAAAQAATALPPGGLPTTRLVRKLKAGDVVPNVTAAARRARQAWTEYERGVTPPLPGEAYGPDFTALRAILTAEAADAQRIAREGGEPYGDRMLADLQDRVGILARDQPSVFNFDPRLLMGLLYDLTAQCEVWWSPEFDVDANPGDGGARE
jgi:hypothetical protein